MNEAAAPSPEVLEANPLDKVNQLVQAGRALEELAALGLDEAEYSIKETLALPDYLYLKLTPRYGNEYDALLWTEDNGRQPYKSRMHKKVSVSEPLIVKVINFSFVSGAHNEASMVLRDFGKHFAADYRLPLKLSEFDELFDKEIVHKDDLG